MNLKNYTSEVPAVRSIGLIEQLLINAGAVNINKTINDDKKVDGITFEIFVKDKLLNFKLPSKVEQVYERLRQGVRRPTKEALERCRAQSERTAWKILYEWVQIQVSMIQINQVEIMEVFLPYAYDRVSGQTFFEKIREGGYNTLQLGNGDTQVEDAVIVE